MVDDTAAFRRKNDRQTDRAIEALERIGRTFIHLLAVDLVKGDGTVGVSGTPGMGNQRPNEAMDGHDTRYIPTGRLRGGWDISVTAWSGGTRYTGGPESMYGDETIAKIDSQALNMDIGKVLFLQNDVAYAYIIVNGLENHAAVGPRPWVDNTAKKGNALAQDAIRSALRRA